MKTTHRFAAAAVVFTITTTFAFAGPRDAEATLNRCGAPLKGDEIVYENSVAGGHRTLKYERGTLIFLREANSGWTFDHGSERDNQLTASEMERYMPCLGAALQDSAAPGPLPKVTSVNRLERSMKDSYRQMILYSLLALVGFGAALFALSRRKTSSEDLA